MADNSKQTCTKCKKTKVANTGFYLMRDGTRDTICKDCLTMHVDNFNPDTYLWLLERYDVPYIEGEWKKLLNTAYLKAGKDPRKLTGLSVFGKYLSKMKLAQYSSDHWCDTEKYAKKAAETIKVQEDEMLELEREYKLAYERGEISEAEYLTLTSVEGQAKEKLEVDDFIEQGGMKSVMPSEIPMQPVYMQYIDESELPDPAAELTKDDKIYLAVKWGKNYTPAEWVELEKHYSEMCESFEINDADTKSALIMLCKTQLKMNQAIDANDFDTYNKLSRVNEAQRKSAHFTAAQNKKDEKSQFVDCIGQLVAYCEEQGGAIPRFEINAPRDVIDEIIKDNKDYLTYLVKEDTALAQQIEDYIKNRENAEKLRLEKESENNELSADDYLQMMEFREVAEMHDWDSTKGDLLDDGIE